MTRAAPVGSFVAMLVAVALHSAPAAACICETTDDDYTTLADRAQVFQGTIVETFAPRPSDNCAGLSGVYYLVEVSRVWRGEVPKKLLLKSSNSSCAAFPEQGSEHIFGRGRLGSISFSMCELFVVPSDLGAIPGDPYPPTDEEEALPTCRHEDAGSADAGSSEGDAASCASSDAGGATWLLLLGVLPLVSLRRRFSSDDEKGPRSHASIVGARHDVRRACLRQCRSSPAPEHRPTSTRPTPRRRGPSTSHRPAPRARGRTLRGLPS